MKRQVSLPLLHHFGVCFGILRRPLHLHHLLADNCLGWSYRFYVKLKICDNVLVAGPTIGWLFWQVQDTSLNFILVHG